MSKTHSLKHILARAACLPILAGLAATPAWAQDTENLAAVPDAAREAAVAGLQSLMTQDPEIAAANPEIATCMPRYIITADSIKTYDGASPETLLRQTDVVCAVKMNGAVGGEERVTEQDGAWRMATLATSGYYGTMDDVRAAFADAAGCDVFRVDIPALYHIYMACRTDEGLTLKFTFDEPDLHKEAGDTANAGEILRRLKPIVQTMDLSAPG